LPDAAPSSSPSAAAPVGPFADAAALADHVRTADLRHAKLYVVDWDGVLRGKYVGLDKLTKALTDGFGFCEVLFGWDIDDQVFDGESFAGWDSGFRDATVRLLPESARAIPFEPATILVQGQYTGRPEQVCPRAMLARALDRLDRLGYRVRAGFEYEFFVFDETPESVRAKGYRDLAPITPGSFGYSVLRQTVHAEFYDALLTTAAAMRLPLEGLHTETGPGVLEAALAVAEGIEVADRAVLFKTMVKALAQRQGRMATFMAKWSDDWPGQSGHIHLSLVDRDDRPAFVDPAAPDGVSEVLRQALGGLVALMPDWTVLSAPTPNSYKRLIPGFWAPTWAGWGVDNRTCALRVIPSAGPAQRIEVRMPGADANPYLALAAAVGSIALGIEGRLDAGAPVGGSGYDAPVPDGRALPATLDAAAERFRASAPARDVFGDAFVEAYARARLTEAATVRRRISDVELARYFESI
jgi:glutamine synthetase